MNEQKIFFEQALNLVSMENYQEACDLTRLALSSYPENPKFYNLLGLIQFRMDRPNDAVSSFKHCITLESKNPEFYNNLGEAYHITGEKALAIHYLQTAISLKKDFYQAYYNLARVNASINDLAQSIILYQHAIRLNPLHFKSYYNLGNLYLEVGRYKSAIDNYVTAISIRPANAESYNNLGVAFKELEQFDAAIENFTKALLLKPDFNEAIKNMAGIQEQIGNVEEAKRFHGKITTSNIPIECLRSDLVCPIVFPDNQSIDFFRSKIEKIIDVASPDHFDLETLHLYDIHPPSQLNYQGRFEKKLKEKYADFIREKISIDERPIVAQINSKPRIGFVVTKNHEGVFLKCMRGIINNFPSDKFEIFIICSKPNGERILRKQILNEKVSFVSLPKKLSEVIAIVRNLNLDLLYHWEIGTDNVNYFLPMLRLARIQCTSWGWPVTSGMKEIDYYISSKFLETDDSPAHYTEKLLLLDRLPTYFYRPTIPETLKSREFYGIESDCKLYLCVQNTRKIHPDFDLTIARILRSDKNGIVVFIGDKHPLNTSLLRQRFENNHSDIASRIHFVPTMEEPEYLNLICLADVVLDTIHYGGGANTTYDAFSVGVPIVTLPTPYHRGRYAYAAYKQIGIGECIARDEDEYVLKAIGIANDRELRLTISDKIRNLSPSLFEDSQVIEELAACFSFMLKEKECDQFTIHSPSEKKL